MAYNLDNYVPVAERLQQAGDLVVTVVSEPPIMLTDVMGYIRVTVALKDGRSATGTASYRLDLQGRSAQATNPIEDCETSAVGRALAFLGYGSTKSIASREEVVEAQRRGGATYAPAQTNGSGSATGKASQKQISALFAIWKNNGYEGDLKAWIEKSYGCGVSDLSVKQASDAIERLKPADKQTAT